MVKTQDCPPKNPSSLDDLYQDWQDENGNNSMLEDRVPDFECRNDIIDFPYVLSYLKLFLEDIFQQKEYFDKDTWDLIKTKAPYVTIMAGAEADKTGYLPCIVIDFGGAGAEQKFGFDGRIDYDIHTGTGSYYAEWQAQYTVTVIAKTRYETFLLGTAIARCLLYAKEPIRKVLKLKSYQLQSIGKVQPRSEDGSLVGYVMPVTLVTSGGEIWYLTEHAPVLKRIVATNSQG